MARRTRPFRARVLGWTLVLLAFVGQIAAAAALPECCQTDPLALGQICSLDHAAAPSPPAAPHRHQPDCAVCPFCGAAAIHAVILAPAPILPAPASGLAMPRLVAPPARAPPAGHYRPGRPRGPPVPT